VTRVTASAPGKFVLSGEYAVLDGAPAICVAVDRRAVVRIEAHDGPCHTVTAPGFSTACGRFTADAGGLSWLADGQDFLLFETVWNASGPSPAEISLGVSLDTTAFREAASGSKIGLGSSAALTVAVATALVSLGGAGLAETAHAAHRLFQGGSGSGVDVACSIAGGIIEYRMEDQRSTPLRWPRSLYYSLLWSGVASATRGKLVRFSGQPGSRSRDELSAASRAVAALWAGGDAPAIVAGVGRYARALRRFDEVHGLGIFDAGHARLAERATEAGLVYKPCGAGGGDIGVALATSRASLASFEKTAMRAGFTTLESSIDPRGAMLHDEDEP
jgi:phosphomevalonate kinase